MHADISLNEQAIDGIPHSYDAGAPAVRSDRSPQQTRACTPVCTVLTELRTFSFRSPDADGLCMRLQNFTESLNEAMMKWEVFWVNRPVQRRAGTYKRRAAPCIALPRATFC